MTTQHTQSLAELLQGSIDAGEAASLMIQGITQNSRDVQAGYLFIALYGTQTHGMQFHQDAIQRGAIALLAEPGGDWSESRLHELAAQCAVPLLIHLSLREQIAQIAARFYADPARDLQLLGITGTNGKTSISHYLAQALNHTYQTGVIGTLGNGALDDLQTATHTTPDAISVQAELARQLESGVEAVAMEVSSHALDQSRVAGMPFHTAVFSNLSRDHQDYHGSMAAYGAAKAKLFQMPDLRYAIINVDDDFGLQLSQQLRAEITLVTCGACAEGEHFVRLQNVVAHAEGLQIQFSSSWGDGEINSLLIGHFNAENLLLVLGVLLAWKMPLDQAIQALEKIQAVKGRMSLLGVANQPKIVIDYAHTPDALEKVLLSAREHTQGRLICVFGCGGERDQGKRPLMGEIAETVADHVYLTNDNPRNEKPDEIIRHILSGTQKPDQITVEQDRSLAIHQAIDSASANDLVVIAGKGHEDYQLIGGETKAFSDFAQAEQALARWSA